MSLDSNQCRELWIALLKSDLGEVARRLGAPHMPVDEMFNSSDAMEEYWYDVERFLILWGLANGKVLHR